jgi:hypothetical protein
MGVDVPRDAVTAESSFFGRLSCAPIAANTDGGTQARRSAHLVSAARQVPAQARSAHLVSAARACAKSALLSSLLLS